MSNPNHQHQQERSQHFLQHQQHQQQQQVHHHHHQSLTEYRRGPCPSIHDYQAQVDEGAHASSSQSRGQQQFVQQIAMLSRIEAMLYQVTQHNTQLLQENRDLRDSYNSLLERFNEHIILAVPSPSRVSHLSLPPTPDAVPSSSIASLSLPSASMQQRSSPQLPPPDNTLLPSARNSSSGFPSSAQHQSPVLGSSSLPLQIPPANPSSLKRPRVSLISENSSSVSPSSFHPPAAYDGTTFIAPASAAPTSYSLHQGHISPHQQQQSYSPHQYQHQQRKHIQHQSSQQAAVNMVPFGGGGPSPSRVSVPSSVHHHPLASYSGDDGDETSDEEDEDVQQDENMQVGNDGSQQGRKRRAYPINRRKGRCGFTKVFNGVPMVCQSTACPRGRNRCDQEQAQSPSEGDFVPLAEHENNIRRERREQRRARRIRRQSSQKDTPSKPSKPTTTDSTTALV